VCKQQRFVGLGDGDGMGFLFLTKLTVKTNVHCSTETGQNKANNALTSRGGSSEVWRDVSSGVSVSPNDEDHVMVWNVN
jgi:hypothetical protein